MKTSKLFATIFPVVFLVLTIAGVIGSVSYLEAGVKQYSNTYEMDSCVADSSAAIETFTDSLVGTTTGAPLFYFGNLDRYEVSVVTGWFEAYIDTVDLDSVGASAASDAPDTTGNDTLILTIYTAFKAQWGTATKYARAGEEALVACTLSTMTYSAAGATGSEGKKFTIPATAGIGDCLYGRIQWKYQQPATSLDDTSQIVYKTHVRMIAR